MGSKRKAASSAAGTSAAASPSKNIKLAENREVENKLTKCKMSQLRENLKLKTKKIKKTTERSKFPFPLQHSILHRSYALALGDFLATFLAIFLAIYLTIFW